MAKVLPRCFYSAFLPQMCGVGTSGIFRAGEGLQSLAGHPTPNTVAIGGGAGWHMVSFTNDPQHIATFKECYELFSKRWQVFVQSPVRINTRTKRKFFFVIFNTKIAKKNIDNSEYEWPL